MAACIYSPLISDLQRVSNELIHITDLLPTFYAAAGGSVNELGALDGVDQWPTIKKAQKSQRDFTLINIEETVDMEAAIDSGGFKYIKSLGTSHPNLVYRDLIKFDQNEIIPEIGNLLN